MNNFFHAPYSVNIQHQFNLSEPLEDSRSFWYCTSWMRPTITKFERMILYMNEY
jgi:hypothetical protein